MAARSVVPAARGKVRATRLLAREPLPKLKQRLGKTAPQRFRVRLCHSDIFLISIEHSYVAGAKQIGMIAPPIAPEQVAHAPLLVGAWKEDGALHRPYPSLTAH